MKEEIVDGLRYAMNKGESLMQAMMSFYNAGYSKKDVEEAAAFLNQPQMPQQIQQPAQVQPRPNMKQVPQNQVQPQLQTPIVQQRASGYGQERHPLSTIMIIVLVFFLLVLIASLISIFLFRDVLTEIFGNLF